MWIYGIQSSTREGAALSQNVVCVPLLGVLNGYRLRIYRQAAVKNCGRELTSHLCVRLEPDSKDIRTIDWSAPEFSERPICIVKVMRT
jgi:hypothetical protein